MRSCAGRMTTCFKKRICLCKKMPPRRWEAFFYVESFEALAAIASGARFDFIGRDVNRFAGDFNPGKCMPLEQFVNAKDFDQTGGELDKEVYVGIDLSADADGTQIVKRFSAYFD